MLSSRLALGTIFDSDRFRDPNKEQDSDHGTHITKHRIRGVLYVPIVFEYYIVASV